MDAILRFMRQLNVDDPDCDMYHGAGFEDRQHHLLTKRI
jgi:hypothetical protein